MTPEIAMNMVWGLWAVSWFAAAFWSTRAASRPGFGAELLYRIVTIAGAILLFGLRTHDPARIPLWTVNETVAWFLVGLAAAGFAFCWWARIHLGRLWSGFVTRKADHHIVDTGPYAIVRHPIYTGIILSAFATAAFKGSGIAFLGAAVMTVGFWIKARLEERFLRQELGQETYDSYRRRVPMLVPFGPA
ncbi:MAG: isoprenylcysteine carboxylmethyltransferase family protein [Rhizomicrobium sp.]|jgi:protein-S-isoprenylcysteine O-methyltransferase Ste14